jgi:hypothetical protein
MASDIINSRTDFFRILDEATTSVARRLRVTPELWAYQNIARQLDAMKKWTSDGRTPTPEERESIDVGLVALRELEPAEDSDEQGFVTNLHELNFYFENWPADPNVGA